MFKLAIIGAGQRGMIYGEAAKKGGLAEIVAVAEPHAGRRQAAAKAFSIPTEHVYDSAEGLLNAGRLGDALIIASMDRDHYRQAMTAMDLGYHLLLEKPVSPDPVECLHIAKKAEETGRTVTVCHVLRYAPFFKTLKAIIDSGEMGRVISIVHNENVGNFHMAHSFVRGNWRKSFDSSPIIMQKSCHDMDLLVWLTGSEAEHVSSFGQLTYFREENAPKGSAARCLECPAAENCRFDARKCYLPIAGNWPASVLSLDQTEEGLRKAIAEGPYGRCVYRCDNDVCDHQIVNIQFKNGVTAAFSLSAFTNRISRTIKVMCEHGEIRGSEYDNRIEIIPFVSTGEGETNARTVFPDQTSGGHNGGDDGLMRDFLALLQSKSGSAATSIARSVESHLIACAAEDSRVSNKTVDMEKYRRELSAAAKETVTEDMLHAWAEYAGMKLPEGVEQYIKGMEMPRQTHLIDPDFLDSAMLRCGMPSEKVQMLRDALAKIEADETLLRLSLVLRQDALAALNRGTACDFHRPEPKPLRGFARDAYAFLYALSCVEPALNRAAGRGIPKEQYEYVPWIMADRQLKKFKETGDIAVSDYPWDMNFYLCAIFLMDRFYFIPFRFGTPEVWRSKVAGQTVALWPGNQLIRRDGQLQGVNGVLDDQAFPTVWREDELSVTAHPVNPTGIVEKDTVTLSKSEWKKVLQEGDYTLALHIPGGEGYNPERLKNSMELALRFYDTYFPSLKIKGFWSESWLYDPGLKALLPKESNIVRVQEQLYCYPTMEGGEMAYKEVFGDTELDLDTYQPKTRLEKAMVDCYKKGIHFHTTGMFVLREDVQAVGSSPYLSRDL